MWLEDRHDFFAWILLTCCIQSRDNFRWMVSKVINDNCFVDNFLCKAALNPAKGLEMFPN